MNFHCKTFFNSILCPSTYTYSKVKVFMFSLAVALVSFFYHVKEDLYYLEQNLSIYSKFKVSFKSKKGKIPPKSKTGLEVTNLEEAIIKKRIDDNLKINLLIENSIKLLCKSFKNQEKETFISNQEVSHSSYYTRPVLQRPPPLFS